MVVVGPGNVVTVCTGAETGTGAETDPSTCWVPGQQGVLGWPVQHGAGLVGCPDHAGNPDPDVGLGQMLLACGAEPVGGQLPHRGSECWEEGREGGGGEGEDGERRGLVTRSEIRGRESVDRMDDTNWQLQHGPMTQTKI